jgi:hypothetical protein
VRAGREVGHFLRQDADELAVDEELDAALLARDLEPRSLGGEIEPHGLERGEVPVELLAQRFVFV